MIHTKYDSDVASSYPSSPSSPKLPIYYVQSPSRDSHVSTQSNLICDSAQDSPSHSSFQNHFSRTSSASRFSGTLRSCSSHYWSKRCNDRGWPECNVILEEEDYLEESRGCSRRCRAFIAITALVLLFPAITLVIICSANSAHKAKIVVETLAINNFIVAEGSDYTGVPTKMATVNSSLMMSIYNPAPLFGIHVSSSPISLIYLKIPIATGKLENCHQARKSHQTVEVIIQGADVPLYGAGEALAMSTSEKSVPLRLEFVIQSQGDVVGMLLRSRQHKHISCSAVIDPDKTKPIKVSQESCTYD